MIKNNEEYSNEIEDFDEENLLKALRFYHFKQAKKLLNEKGKS